MKKLRHIFGILSLVLASHGISNAALAQACSITQPSLTNGGQSATVSSPFGMRNHPVSGQYKMHTGTDLNLPGNADCNQPVQTQQGCTRKFYGPKGGYGNLLIMDCGNGVELYYAHLSNYNDTTKTVYVGNTGVGTGCHLHNEVRIDNKIVDPECVWGSNPSKCPAGMTKPDMCNAQDREKLKNNSSSVQGSSSPSNSNTGTNSGSQVTQNPNGSTTTTTTTQNPNGGSTTTTQTNNPDGSTSTTTTVTNPDGSTTTTTTSVAGNDDDTTENTYTSSTPATHTGGDTTSPTDTPNDTPTPGDPVAGSELVPTKPDDGNTQMSGCATDTWTGMVNQAVLEARRETVMNQTYIVKPDSVLVYGCLKHWLKSVQDNAGPIFSETTRFASPVDISSTSPRRPKVKFVDGFPGLGGGSLDAALSSTVYSAADAYLNANFNHKLLGDTSTLTGDAINCGVMQNVWQAAKCTNFSTAKVFYKFDELMTTDPRKYPASIPCNDTGIKQEMIDYAQNKEFKKVTFDKVKTRLDLLADPSSCDLSIKTGIKVHQMNNGTLQKNIDDVVCSNVGCGSKEGTCQKL